MEKTLNIKNLPWRKTCTEVTTVKYVGKLFTNHWRLLHSRVRAVIPSLLKE